MTQTDTIPAAPKKLRDGSWGALAQTESVRAGDTVTITTRAGKSWDAVVEKVIWTGKGVSILATAAASRKPETRAQTSRGGQWSGCSCGSIEDRPRSSDCWTCRHDS